MAQLAQGLGLDLADTLTGDVELLAHLLQGAGAAVLDAEAQLQHLLLTGGQGAQHVHQLLLQQREAGGLAGLGRALVGDEVAQMAVLLLTDGRLQGHGLLCDLQNLPHLVHGHAHLGGDLLGRGIVAQLLQQLAADPDDLVDGLHHMYGDADGAGLVGDGAGDGLADPPGGVGGELIALGVVELLHRLDEAQVALLDQIQEQHAAAHIPLGDGHHQTEVGLGQLLLGLAALLDVLFQLGQLVVGDGLAVFGGLVDALLGGASGGHGGGQHHLLVSAQQRHTADLLQIHAHRIVDVEAVHQRVGVDQLLLLDLGDLLQGRLDIVVDAGQELLGAHLDAQRLQRVVDAVHLLALQIHLVQHVADLAGIQLALLLALGQHVAELFVGHDQRRGGQRGDGLVVQLALVLALGVALGTLGLRIRLGGLGFGLFRLGVRLGSGGLFLLVILGQQGVGHLLHLLLGIGLVTHVRFPPYRFLSLNVSCANSRGSSPEASRLACSSRITRM